MSTLDRVGQPESRQGAAGRQPSKDARRLQLVEAVVESARDAIFCIAADGEILLANSSAQQLGITIGGDWLDLRAGLAYQPTDDSDWLDDRGRLPVDRALEGLDFPRSFTVVLERERRRLEMGVSLARFELGSELAVVVVAQDLTDRLRERSLLDSALEVVDVPVWCFDTSGRWLRASRAATELLGHDPADLEELEEALDLHSWLGDQPLEGEKFPPRAVLQGQEVNSVPVRARLRGGPELLLRLSATVSERERGLVVVCRDVSELDAAQRRAADLQARLAELSDRLG